MEIQIIILAVVITLALLAGVLHLLRKIGRLEAEVAAEERRCISIHAEYIELADKQPERVALIDALQSEMLDLSRMRDDLANQLAAGTAEWIDNPKPHHNADAKYCAMQTPQGEGWFTDGSIAEAIARKARYTK